MKKINIAIDGFSSTGKSTLAKQLAQKLGYVFVDSGAMYRAITLFAMQHGYISDDFFDKSALVLGLDAIRLEFRFNQDLGFSEMFLNDVNVEVTIRTIEVSSFVSRIAEVSEVRSKLVEQQQFMGKNKGVVMDGRDIGTVVFVDAELKIFMTASAETRARRRFAELRISDPNLTFEAVYKNVQERDYIDTHREDSPLRKADDAIEINNSNMDKTEQFELVLDLVQSKLT